MMRSGASRCSASHSVSTIQFLAVNGTKILLVCFKLGAIASRAVRFKTYESGSVTTKATRRAYPKVLPEKWEPVFRQEALQSKSLEPFRVSTKIGTALRGVMKLASSPTPIERQAEFAAVPRRFWRSYGRRRCEVGLIPAPRGIAVLARVQHPEIA